jgi:glucan phosphoethanolaminetransferase (alkaline phosphatase superfamily)
MNNVYSVKDKLTLFLLASGVICFGVVLPDSLSTHVKMVHYAAHFGMSFLIALCFYMICTVKMRLPKIFSYSVLICATLLIGAVYKYWEISTQGMIGNYSFHTIIDLTGTMTSMSQNLSGLAGAILLIEGLLDRNLALSVLKPNTLQISKNGNMRVVGPVNHSKPLGNIQVVKHFSTAAEN